MPGCASNHITPLGTITSSDSKIWVVPAETQFQTGPFASDLHNTCNQVAPVNLAAANLSNVPITEIDANGELITGFLFADNYFELYINGVLVGVDAVPFTPFNSSVVKFRVSRPYTIAVKLVDWEEHPGLGSEIQVGDSYHPGDGGFIAQFTDTSTGEIIATTNGDWRGLVIQNAPLNVECEKSVDPDTDCQFETLDEPANWTSANFDDSSWINATSYLADEVGVKDGYNEITWDSMAEIIWGPNLNTNNTILWRTLIR
jgi:hypothetical protein